MSIDSFKKRLTAINPNLVKGHTRKKQIKSAVTIADKKKAIADNIDLRIKMLKGETLTYTNKKPKKWFEKTSDGQYYYSVWCGLSKVDWLDSGGADYGPASKEDVIRSYEAFKDAFVDGTDFDAKVKEIWDKQKEAGKKPSKKANAS